MPRTRVTLGSLLLVLTVSSLPGPLLAVSSLPAAVSKAVQENPDVQAQWSALLGARYERQGAMGAYLPRVDLLAYSGSEYRDRPDFTSVKHFKRAGTALTLNQLLFDGFALPNEVKRLNYARLARYHSLREASEGSAVEAVRAYLNVLRFRRLLQLAQDNYTAHEAIFKKLEERAKAGVSKLVDLEQASGRLALARVNVVTATSNLADMDQRYRRIVGEAPAVELSQPESLRYRMPTDTIALREYSRAAPTLQGALAQVSAATAASHGVRSAYWPTLELRARRDEGNDLDGVHGEHDTHSLELVMTYNLFNGWSDASRGKQYSAAMQQAQSLSEKACRDLRLQVGSVYSELSGLLEQKEFLLKHQAATAKVRAAYRQ